MARKNKSIKTTGKGRHKVSMTSLSKELRQNQEKERFKDKKRENHLAKMAEQNRQRSLKKAIVPYSASDNILLVGEANCSMARAIVRHFRKQVTAKLNQVGYPIPEAKAIRRGCPIDFHLYSMLCEQQKQELEDAAAGTAANGADEDEDQEEFDEDEEVIDEDEDLLEDEDEEEYDEDEEESEEDRKYNALLAKGVEQNDGSLLYTYQTCASRLLVTCYDSLEDSLEKYPDLPAILAEVQSAGAQVVFGVDCSSMGHMLAKNGLIPPTRFDRIAFYFPHVGSGEQDRETNIKENQSLILAFLTNAVDMLAKPKIPKTISIKIHNKNPNLSVQNLIALSELDAQQSNEHDDMTNNDQDEDDDEDADALEEEITDQLFSENQETMPFPQRISAASTLSHNDDGTLTLYRKIAGSKSGGTILVTTKTGEPYDSWRIPVILRSMNRNQITLQQYKEEELSKDPGSLFKQFPKLKLLRKVDFFPELYSGYTHRRTIGFKDGISANDNAEILRNQPNTFVFCRAPELAVDRGIGLTYASLNTDQQTQLEHKTKTVLSRRQGGKALRTRKAAMKARGVASSGRKRR